VAALTKPSMSALPMPSFEDVTATLPMGDGPMAAIPSGSMGFGGPDMLSGAPLGGGNSIDDLRQKFKPAPQERLARMVDLNEERSAQILRKWAAAEAA
jgi:flagellar M-ring protein FliF